MCVCVCTCSRRCPVTLEFNQQQHTMTCSSARTCPSLVSRLLILTILSVHSIAAQSILKDSQLRSPTLTRCHIDCTYEPLRSVCGMDGRTYASKCELQRANCQGHSVQIKHKGKCQEKFRCWEERAQAQNVALGPMENLFVPQCNEDGSYTEVQCHAGTGYCWCVTRSGKPISGSSVKNRRPKCRPRAANPNTRFRNPGRPPYQTKQECKQVDRIQFNKNLVDLFITEYKRVAFLSKTATTLDPHLDSFDKRAMDWKFSELDKNANQNLERGELKHFRKMMKKIGNLRDCAKHLTFFCDMDKDRRISRNEWTICLSKNTERTEANGHNGPPFHTTEGTMTDFSTATVDQPSHNGRNPDKDPDDTLSCPEERQKAVEKQKSSQDSLYIPDCDPNGKYAQVQCFKTQGYCWCVDRENGKPIPNTSLYKIRPDCEKMLRALRPIKGCAEKKRSKFITEFVDLLTKEMSHTSNNSSSAAFKPNHDQSVLDVITRWKFDNLDTNANRVLDRKEWKNLRKDMKKKKSIRKCGRSFIKFCDDNNDKKITYDEWLECFSILRERNNNSNRRSKGQNPLDKYLKTD